MITNLVNFAIAGGEKCTPDKSGAGFFGFPTWYKYLPGERDLIDPSKCIPKVEVELGNLPALALGLVDILLFVAGFIAVGYVLYGGFQYLISQGEPERTGHAKNTILNAVIGLVIVLIAIAVVSFIGGRLG